MCYTCAMAYRITPTTESDADLLNRVRDRAWQERKDVSEVVREAFTQRLAVPVRVPEQEEGVT